jgi:HAD superfamily hydrolase (TIGR01509 family)
VVRAVIFDLDGVILDSEQVWDRARREVVDEHGGHWVEAATASMQGMSSPEWSRYLHDDLGVRLSPEQISELVTAKVLASYEKELPVIPGAVEAVWRIHRRWPLGLASSAGRPVIDRVLSDLALLEAFAALVSSEEVARGKPAPDVYIEVVRRLGLPAEDCAAVEDSTNGIGSAIAAGLRVVAIPNPHYPPTDGALGRAQLVLKNISDLTVGSIEELDTWAALDRRLDEEEMDSFPASDPHSDWAGPPN